MTSSNGHRPRLRDVAHERAFTIAAAALIERSPVPIMQLSEERAPVAPLRDFATRDFCLDTLEELADARNYIDWEALRIDLAHQGRPDGRLARAALQHALAHIIEAFGQVTLARSLLHGLETVDAES